MNRNRRLVSELTTVDLQNNPVWEFIGNEAVTPDTTVRPVTLLPVKDLAGKLVGTEITLHNGNRNWAILGNVSLQNPRSTKHFLSVSIEKNGVWFHLARYHDVDNEQRGPAELAVFLNLSVPAVFPIEYDISNVALGHPDVLRGSILAEPDERLTTDQLIDLSLQD